MNTIKLSKYGVTITDANIGQVNKQVTVHPIDEPLTLDFEGIRGIDSKVANELLASLRSRQGGQVFIKNTEPMVKSVLIFSGSTGVKTVAPRAAVKKRAPRRLALFSRLFSLLCLLALSFGFSSQAWAASSEFSSQSQITVKFNSNWRSAGIIKVKCSYNEGNDTNNPLSTTTLIPSADGEATFTTPNDNYCRFLYFERINPDNQSQTWDHVGVKASTRSDNANNYITFDNNTWTAGDVNKDGGGYSWSTKISYSVTISAGSNGSITSGSGSKTYTGTPLSVTVAANDGYEFDNWVCSNASVTGTYPNFSVSASANNATAQATFKKLSLPNTRVASKWIIFAGKKQAKSLYSWEGTAYTDLMTYTGSYNNYYVSYFDNSSRKNTKAIFFDDEHSGSGWQGDNNHKLTGDITEGTATANNYYKSEATSPSSSASGGKFSTFTSITASLSLSSSSVVPNTTVTLTGSCNSSTLYSLAGSKADFAFYAVDGSGNITLLQSKSETKTASFTPTAIGTYTLYCYVYDKYGLEINRASQTLTVTNPEYTGLSISDDPPGYVSSASTLSVYHVAQGSSVTINKGTPKAGYEFDQIAVSDGILDGTTWTPSANSQSVTVKWKAKTNTAYTVKHYKQNLAGTGYDLADTDNLTGTTDASVTPAVKSYEGFTAPSTQTATILGDGSLVITYNYTRNSHSLTWDADGGTITGTYTSGTVKYGASITAPASSNVKKAGFNFMGWMVNSSVVTPATTMPDNDLTYTAKWESATTYSLTVVAGTGVSAVSGNKSDQTAFPFSSNISAEVKDGYTFSTWTKTAGEGSVTFDPNATTASTKATVTGGGSVTLTASATPNTNTPYTVKHYKQNLAGTGYDLAGTDNLTGTTDASVTPAVKSYEGFTAPTAKTVTIAGNGSTVVEYQYARKSFTLTWDLDGGTITQAGTAAGSVKYGAELTAPTVEKAGYNFTGWNPDVPSTMPAANSTYTAQWSAILYNVTCPSNDAYTVTGLSAQYGTDSPVAFTVTANTGYKVTSVSSTDVTITKNDDNYSFTMPAKAVSITIDYEINSGWYLGGSDFGNSWEVSNKAYPLNRLYRGMTDGVYYRYGTVTTSAYDCLHNGTTRYRPTENKTFSGSGYSNKIDLTSTSANANFQFKTAGSYYIIADTRGATPIVWYEATEPSAGNYKTISVTNGTQGTYTLKTSAGFATTKFANNEQYKLVVTANSNAYIPVVTVAGSPVELSKSSNTYTYTGTMPNSDVAIVITYMQQFQVTFGYATGCSGTQGTYTVKNGSASVTSGSYIINGTELTFAAEAKPGYQFDGWYTAQTSGIKESELETYNKTIDAATALYAKFSNIVWTVTVNTTTGGTTSPSGERANVTQVDGLNINVTPAIGYYFDNWTKTAGDGSFTKAATTASNNFKPTSDATIQANFAQYASTLSLDKANYFIGQNITVTPALDNHYPSTFTLCYELWLDGEKAATQPDFEINATTGVATFIAPTTTGTTYTVKAFIHDGGDCNAAVIDEFMSSTFTVAAIPTPTVNYTQTRAFGESTGMALFNTNNFYDDETVTLTLTATNTPAAGATARYKFGTADASTTNTYDVTAANLDEITVNYEVYFATAHGESEHASGTITLKPVATPKLYLTSDLTNNEVEVENAGQVTIMYRTEYYTGSATITKDDAFWKEPSGQQANYTENYGKTVKQYLYIATTAVTNERTFADTLAINVYKTVKIKVQDTNNWATNVYMWNSTTGDIKSAWPGDGFTGKIGNWHVFYVKYPNYDKFVISDGSNAGTDGHKQTVDVTVPQENTCYAIAGSPIAVSGNDYGKYACNTTTCGAGLYVDDIATQNVYTGDGKLVTPVVEMDPEYRDEDLEITFTYGTAGKVTATQQGRNILLTGNATGSTTVTATYSINGDQVQKTFTVNVTGKIMIQVKYDPSPLGWSNHDEIYIRYFNHGLSETTFKMTFKDYVDNQDRLYATIPLGSDGKVDFVVYAWNTDEDWHVSWDGQNVDKSGCYSIYYNGDNKKRKLVRDGDDCWAEYQVEINMGDGTTTYHSNTVTNTDDMISFFAPGVSETGYKAGLVRIMKNGMTLATVPGTTFDSSYVYVAKIDAGNKTLTDVAPYKGDYYIRTDAVNPNNKTDAWDITKYVADRTLTYFTPFEGAKYDYYWVKNVQQNDGINVQGCVANTYNKDLANKIVASDYTDGDGKVNGNDVSVRFGYNPNTNYFERAVIKGSAQNDFLNVVGNNAYNDAECTQELNESNYDSHKEYSKFSDVSDWVYEKYVYVKVDATHPGSAVVLKSKAYNGNTMYQLGYTTNPMTGKPTSTPATKTILGSSTTNGLYRLDMIYDFKTNRLISAWAPETGTIDKLNIDADVLFLRHENRDAAQITLKNDDSQVTSLESVIFVMELRKDTLPDQTGHYWFTLPFDCDINTIFGVEGYLDIWGIQRYNGEKRSHGWFKEDDATFWTWMDKNETLKAGEGYVLHFDKKNAAWKTIDDRSILRLYFPSKTKEFKMTKTAADMTMTYEDHTCTVKGREAIDSNWRLLGSFSYNNISMNSWTDRPTEEHEYSGDAAHFLYKIHDDWTKEDKAYGKYELLEAGPGTGFTYHAFFCYMTQFSGTVNWAQFTRTESEAQAQKQGLAPRRATNENEITSAHLRLNMTKGDLQQDYTYIYLEDGATAGFDNNRDLVKIRNDKFVQLYTMTEVDPLAGNVLPVEDQIIPVAVNLTTAGTYTFAMPDGTDGAEVYLVDSETGKHTDMSISSYTVDLQKGRVEDRFYLDIKATKRTTPTVIDLVDGDGNVTGDQLMKFIRNDHMYIMRDGKLYDGAGTSVK